MNLTLPGESRARRPGKLLCIGKNYAKHAAEMESEVPKEPVVFLKPTTSLIPSGSEIRLPSMSSDVHHEVELVLVIGREGKDIAEVDAMAYVAAYAVGLDITARDLQAAAKHKGHPWSVAKGFDTFAPLGELCPADNVADPQALDVRLTVNGAVRQDGSTRDMVFSIPTLIAYCSRIFTLEPGDLLFTGTPDGVGPIVDGDVLEATITGLPSLRVTARQQAS